MSQSSLGRHRRSGSEGDREAGAGERIVALAEKTRRLARGCVKDVNERNLLVHMVLLRTLRTDPYLSRMLTLKDLGDRVREAAKKTDRA